MHKAEERQEQHQFEILEKEQQINGLKQEVLRHKQQMHATLYAAERDKRENREMIDALNSQRVSERQVVARMEEWIITKMMKLE